MEIGDHGSEEARVAADQAAQHLVNLLDQEVAGKFPRDLVTEELSTGEILEKLQSGEIKPASFSKDLTFPSFIDQAPRIILSGALNGGTSIWSRIETTVGPGDFLDPMYAELFNRISRYRENGLPRSKIVSLLSEQIPSIWQSINQESLRGSTRLGVYHMWLQIIHSEVDDNLLKDAIDVVTNAED